MLITPPPHTHNPRLYFPSLCFTFPLFLRFHGSFTLSSNTSNLCLFLPHEKNIQIFSPIQLHLRKIRAGGRDCGDLSLITREYLDSVCHCYSTSEAIPLPTNNISPSHTCPLYILVFFISAISSFSFFASFFAGNKKLQDMTRLDIHLQSASPAPPTPHSPLSLSHTHTRH